MAEDDQVHVRDAEAGVLQGDAARLSRQVDRGHPVGHPVIAFVAQFGDSLGIGKVLVRGSRHITWSAESGTGRDDAHLRRSLHWSSFSSHGYRSPGR